MIWRSVIVTFAVTVSVCADGIFGQSPQGMENLFANFNRSFEAGDYRQAEQFALAMRRLAQGRPDDAESNSTAAACLAGVWHALGRNSDAEPLFKQSLSLREKHLGPDHLLVAEGLHHLAIVEDDLGRYEESEAHYRRALQIRKKALGSNHSNVAATINGLGALYAAQARYAEAEPLFRQAARTHEVIAETNTVAYGRYLSNIAAACTGQSRYAEAEPLLRQALAKLEAVAGPTHPFVTEPLSNLGVLCSNQGRLVEAETLLQRTLRIQESALGREHPLVARNLSNLAGVYTSMGRYPAAILLYRRAMDIVQKAFPGKEDALGELYVSAGCLYDALGNLPQSEQAWEKAVEIYGRIRGDDHPATLRARASLAHTHFIQDRCDKAETLLDRVFTSKGWEGLSARAKVACYSGRAALHCKHNRLDEAEEDLRAAMGFVDVVRGQSSGDEFERASHFSSLAKAFDQMLELQSEVGHTGLAFETIERSRARSLWDRMCTAGANPLAGLPRQQAAELRRRDEEARGQLIRVQKQFEILGRRVGLSAAEREQFRAKLQVELREARQQARATYRDVRNSSPAYRLAVRNFQPVDVERLQSWVDQEKSLVLAYYVSHGAVCVLVVPGGRSPRLVTLEVSEALAGQTAIQAGPLTQDGLHQVLGIESTGSVLHRLRTRPQPHTVEKALPTMPPLWEMLVPETEREAILAGKYQRLVVLPDGPLAQLPFESLVVEPGDHPKYLLDVGPPIIYAPSATILLNLAEREIKPTSTARAPVLTIGDVPYGEADPGSEDTTLATRHPRSRYVTLGSLTPLPYTKWETNWVSKVFASSGTSVAALRGDMTTERTVRFNVTDRRIIHFACHGLIDQAYGNLFGALVLTPGPSETNPADDGFLTLAEIYELNLKDCELAILSACETNAGPHQRGEGVWALSRGFLVAGARRVVASNWLVDDESAASLISYFCSIIAKAEAAGEKPDYAEALWKAKRWVRNHPDHPEWKHPYYWGTFVLVGPN